VLVCACMCAHVCESEHVCCVQARTCKMRFVDLGASMEAVLHSCRSSLNPASKGGLKRHFEALSQGG
jgi:hypothetical protein